MTRRRDAVAAALARIECDAALNAWSYVDSSGACAAAEESDRRSAAGLAPRALEGELLAIKANIAVRGWPDDGGLLVRQGVIAQHDSPVITRLRDAGAILLGQTRMDAGALGAEGRSIEGPISNPRSPEHSAGGSSGGSAAAIAAGHVALALGTDTIGSVRIPAAYCGISALKPSAGRISRDGVLPVHASFDHVGPMAAAAADLEPLWCVLAGETRPQMDERSAPWNRSRIGYLADAEALGSTSEVLDHYRRGLATLRSLGATLEPIDMAPLDPARVRRAIFSLCEHAMWLQHRELLERQPQKYSVQLAAMIRYGGTLDEHKRATFENRIEEFARSMLQLMLPLHALVLPTTPSQAFALAGTTPANLADLTAIATAAALPAASVPLPTGGALPVGLQIVTHANGDLLACRLAAAFERAVRESR